MGHTNSSDSPLETAAVTVGSDTIEGLDIISDEIRMAILLALWEKKDPNSPQINRSDPVVPFADLRRRVGHDDPGNFRYHLNKLVGHFVHRDDAGYSLTEMGERLIRTLIAGTLTNHEVLEGEPIDVTCFNCESPVVMDYKKGVLITRCTRCEGLFTGPDIPNGTLSKLPRPPAGLIDRAPEEFDRQVKIWDILRIHLCMKGVCPDCSGSVNTTIHLCEEHNSSDGTVCKNCGTRWETHASYVCSVCKYDELTPGYAPIFAEMAVQSFYFEHGLNLHELVERRQDYVLHDVIEVDVIEHDPVSLRVTLEIDDDRLVIHLDEAGQAVDIERTQISSK